MNKCFKILILILCMVISTITVFASQNISARVRRNFQIKLESNPTTGYSWDLAKPVDKSYLRLVKNEYKQNRHPSMMVGVGGVETWVFKPLKKGSTTIYLQYRRPWEKEKAVEIKSFTVLIK